MQDGSLNSTARGPAGPHSGGDDTRERKKRETVTEAAAEKRYLKKRTREGGSKGGAVATALGQQMTCSLLDIVWSSYLARERVSQ